MKNEFEYALTENEIPVDVRSLSNEDRKDYRCPGCGGVVRPVLGKIRRKHFRHKHDHDCSLETYLHKIGKILFFTNYKECLDAGKPFFVEYEVPVFCNYCKHGPCKQKSIIKDYNLANKFNFIEIENNDGSYRPDILLKTITNDKIYIEMVVTNSTSLSKIDSGIKIIDIFLETEDDLNLLSSNKSSLPSCLAKYYNFCAPIYKNFQDNCVRINVTMQTIASLSTLPDRKESYEPFQIPKMINCSICGKNTDDWVSLNPDVCRECVNAKWSKRACQLSAGDPPALN